MMKLNRLHQSRFNKAKQLFESMVTLAVHHELVIMYGEKGGEQILIKPTDIKIGNNSIAAELNDCVFSVFYADPTYDEGLGLTTKEFAAETRRNLN